MFRALRHRNYRLWFFGQGVSLVGTWMQTVAQQVLVYRLTGSAAALGIISFIGLIPLFPFALWGGSLSDRVSKRKIILIAQSIMLIQAFLLAALVWSEQVQVWQVYVLSLILSAAVALDLPARQAFTVEMVEGKADLTNAIGLNSAMFNGSRALGPAVAGVVVATAGEGWAFFVNGLTFIAVIISLLMMRNLPVPAEPRKVGSTIQHLGEGFRFVFSQRILLSLVSLVAVSAFLSMPYNTLLPVFAGDVLEGSARPVVDAICGGAISWIHCQSPEALPLGILFSAIGVGALVGALTVASLPETYRRGRLLTIGNLAFPLALLLFSASRSFVWSGILMLAVGFSFVWQNALANTLIQFAAPDALRGRVMALYTLSFQAMFRVGGLQAGLVGDWVGAPFAVGVGAVVSLFYGIFIALKVPEIRKM